MVNEAEINNIVVESFRKNALRNVLLVDERFPKLHQVGTDEFDNEDASVCKLLYEEFTTLGLLCDVENDVETAKGNASELVRKSDLLILDLHLNKTDPRDTTDSTQILQTLADSEQFNIVIVYTNEKAIKDVALQLAGSLRGTVSVDDDEEARDAIDVKLAEVLDESKNIPYADSIDYYLFSKARPNKELGNFFGQIARDVEKPHNKLVPNIVAQRLAIESLTKDYGSMPSMAREIENGNLNSENPWFVCGSVFVVIANKEGSPPGTGALLNILDGALIEWNPGVVRCLLSEIYNCIGKSGYPFRSAIGKDVITQIAWLYHARLELAESDENAQQVVGQLTSQVIGLLRERVVEETSLAELSLRSLKAVDFKDDPKERIEELQLANGIPDHTSLWFPHVLHALNEFLSSRPFGRRAYVTTGTLLKVEPIAEAEGADCAVAEPAGGPDKSGNRQVGPDAVVEKAEDWWLCVEPQCDTVPEQAGDNRFIRLRMQRLYRKNNLDALENATHSRFIFCEHDGERIYLDTREGEKDSREIFEVYVARDDQVSWEGDVAYIQYLSIDPTVEPLGMVEGRLIAVSQLRDANANRFLHEAGHHQSRIGVDYVGCSNEEIEALNAPKGKK